MWISKEPRDEPEEKPGTVLFIAVRGGGKAREGLNGKIKFGIS